MRRTRVIVAISVIVLCAGVAAQAGGRPNVALNGTATGSTEAYGGVPGNAINGNLGDFTHTADGDANKWWEVDLGADFDLKEIVVYNRASCCGERLNGAVVKALDANRNEIFASDPIADAVTGDVRTFDNEGVGFAGVRYIRLEGGTNYLSLGEVQAWPFWPYADNPDPADGAVDVTSPIFSWTVGDTAAICDVYVGTSPELTETDYMGQWPNMYYHLGTLEPGVTYYWRVDGVEAEGNKITGEVWSFTVQPLTAHFPNPADGAMYRQTSMTISWVAGQTAVSHMVYGATDEAAVAAGDASVLLGTIAEPAFDASGLLEPDTTYFWRVDEVDDAGTVYPGEVWSFSTVDSEGGAVAQYWAKMFKTEPAFVGEPDVVKIVPEINFDWGSAAEPGVNSPDVNIPVDRFSCRWTAELNVPVTGTYKLYDASDDGARMFLNGVRITNGWVDRGTTEDASANLELVAGQRYMLEMEMYENGGGAAAYLRWSGPGFAKEIIPAGAIMPPQGAFSFFPRTGAVDVDSLPVLSWSGGAAALQYNVYLSKNEDLVAAGDASVLVAQQAETSFVPAERLDRGTTNYWRIDAVTADGSVIPGLVSSIRIADDNTDNWASGIAAAEPGYVATFVKNGTYDIGAFGAEMTYEFIVRSNPDETMASMCLIGRLNFGDTKAGLKYEQWNNTGTYGATVFGVTDFDYGVPTAPGEYTHLVFVASTAAGTTDLYVNGELKGSIAAAITLSGTVGIGRAIRENGTFVDNFDGDIFGVAIYDKVLSAAEIAKHADIYFNPIEITDPDMLIYYDFEAGAGTTVIDQSGHGNSGELHGSPQWTQGLFGGCLSLDKATGDYVQAAPLNIVSNTVTVCGWVKHDATPVGWSGILTHRGTSPGNVGLQHNGSEGPLGAELRYMWGADSYWSFSSGLVVPNGEWYFAALAISPTQGKLYLNGVDQTATNVAEHVPSNFDNVILVGRDTDAARLMTCLIDEVRFYNRTLTDVEIQKLVVSDVTAPGDTVQGVPNDVDWPGAEYPALAIDDNANTKFLHFKGELLPTGIQVTPAVGPTFVTGLTFTTANDSPGRDPVKFELSGSNDSIDGPWTLIAAGDIVDFNQVDAWPRFTTNATAISFANTVAYEHYQIVFPALRNPVTDPMMQIAEIELLGTLAPLFVEDFESYEAGTDLHGQGGWKGWQNTATAGAPASNVRAFSGANSVEIIGSADLVHEFDVAGGVVTLSAMQYIPSGSTGTTFFILMNQYDDPGATLDWSVQTNFDMTAGVVNFDGGATAAIVFDQWVEVKCVIDLNNNSVENYYNGVLGATNQWDNDGHGTLQAIDLYGNSASSVWYDDLVVK